MHPKTGSGERACEPVGVFACEADKLISDTHKNGENKYSDNGINPGDLLVIRKKRLDNEACEDTQQYHKEHKACTASGVETGVLLSIFGSKLLACLKTSNGLMLCAVVHKGTLDVGHK